MTTMGNLGHLLDGRHDHADGGEFDLLPPVDRLKRPEPMEPYRPDLSGETVPEPVARDLQMVLAALDRTPERWRFMFADLVTATCPHDQNHPDHDQPF